MRSATRVWIPIIICAFHFFEISFSAKLKFTSVTECDRFSLDALYHEKHKHIIEDVIADSTEFVNRVTKLTAESIMDIMANLPGRDSSDKQELEMHRKFDIMKRKFTKAMNEIKKNLTADWESLLTANFEMLLDRDNSSIESVRQHMVALTESYRKAREALDSSMATVLSPVKMMVRSGLQGIVSSAKSEILRKRNETATEGDSSDDIKDENIDEEELRRTINNITTEIVPSFLGEVTLVVNDKRIDLQKEIVLKPIERDSAFDEAYFSAQIMQARIKSIVHEDLPKSKDSRDLARRNVYMYWSDLNEGKHEEKMKKVTTYTTTANHRKQKYTDMWKSDQDLINTLVNLMQVYP